MTDSRSELPDREMVARVVAEQLGECWERLVDEHLNPSFCKEDFRRCADAILFLLVGGDQKKLTADGQHQTEQSGKQLSQALEPWRVELDELVGHLGGALMQSTDRDDQIIMDHVKAAHEIAKIIRRKA